MASLKPSSSKSPPPKAPSVGAKSSKLAGDIRKRYPDKSDAPEEGDPGSLAEKLKAKDGPGKAPDPGIREKLAGALGAETQVAKFHTGPAAAQAASALQARAFTVGHDVFFGSGQYDPATRSGVKLIAHEATHVMQQTGMRGDTARFFSQRGGDEMEQEAQATAELVLRNLGSKDTLHVREFVRRYSTEASEPIAPSERARLDEISHKAIRWAQIELRRIGPGNIPSTGEMVVDIDLDLEKMSDEEAAAAWGQAIVEEILALKATATPAPKALQKDPAPPAPTNESLDISVVAISPMHADAPLTLHTDWQKLFTQMMGLSEFQPQAHGSIRVLQAILKDYLDVNAFDKSKAYLQTSNLQITIPHQKTGDADTFTKLSQSFRLAGQAAKAKVDQFLKDYETQGKATFLDLTDVSRKAVYKKLLDYGFISSMDRIKDPKNYTYASGNDESKKIQDEAKRLLPFGKHYEEDKEAKENLDSWWHRQTSLNATLKAEEIRAKNLPNSLADFNREKAASMSKYPILSHYPEYEDLKDFAEKDDPKAEILDKLKEILVSLDKLEDTVNSDPGKIIYDIPNVREAAKKNFPEPWQKGYVDMVAEDRSDAAAGLKLTIGAILGALSLATGGAAGFAAIAIHGALFAGGAYQLYEEITDYQLQKAENMSDMDKAKALSKDDPSLFWLAFDFITTAVGLSGDLTAIYQGFKEVSTAYKLARITGETTELESILARNKVPQVTITQIVKAAVGATAAVVNFIRNPDPMGALAVFQAFEGFHDLRTAVLLSKETPPTLPTAKLNLEQQRNKIVQDVVANLNKGKGELVQFKIVEGGFAGVGQLVVDGVNMPLKPAAPSAPEPGGSGTLKGLGPKGPQSNDPSHTLPGLGPLPTNVKPNPIAAPGELLVQIKPPKAGTVDVNAKTPVQDPAAAPGGKPPENPVAKQATDAITEASRALAKEKMKFDPDYQIKLADGLVDVGFTEAQKKAMAAEGIPFVETFEGIYLSVGSKRFTLNKELTAKIAKSANAVAVYTDVVTGKNFIFKPGSKENPLLAKGGFYAVNTGDYFVRGRMAYDIALDLPSMSENMIPTAVAVYEGQAGSLQPFIEGTTTLTNALNDPVTGPQIKSDPDYIRFRTNLYVYDYIINNLDRHMDNFLVEPHGVGADGKPKFKIYGIDQDLGFRPDFLLAIDPERSQVPQGVPGYAPGKGKLQNFGKITPEFFNELLRFKAGEKGVRDSMKEMYPTASDAVLDGIFNRLDQTINDFKNRMAEAKAKGLPENSVFDDPTPPADPFGKTGVDPNAKPAVDPLGKTGADPNAKPKSPVDPLGKTGADPKSK